MNSNPRDFLSDTAIKIDKNIATKSARIKLSLVIILFKALPLQTTNVCLHTLMLPQ